MVLLMEDYDQFDDPNIDENDEAAEHSKPTIRDKLHYPSRVRSKDVVPPRG
jgi:hypothetical protein